MVRILNLAIKSSNSLVMGLINNFFAYLDFVTSSSPKTPTLGEVILSLTDYMVCLEHMPCA